MMRKMKYTKPELKVVGIATEDEFLTRSKWSVDGGDITDIDPVEGGEIDVYSKRTGRFWDDEE